MGAFGIWHWIIAAAIVYLLFSLLRGGRSRVESICPSCGSQGYSKIKTKGSIWIEVVLWLCLIVPGLIYSLWRMSSRHEVCPVCDKEGMIPSDSPNGQLLISKFAYKK